MTYILYNPRANGGNGYAGVQKVVDSMQDRDADVRDITRLDTAALLSGMTAADTVILCGGDGTLHHFINAVEGMDIAVPIYVWRFGTGNDFLRDVPRPGKGRMVCLNDYIKNLPHAELQGMRVRFLNNCSFGLDGQVCELGESEKRTRKQKLSYAVLAIRLALKEYHPTNATVTVDGETRTYQKVWIASALNGRYIGSGMKMAPGQDRLSDKLCCVVWRGSSRLGTLVHLVSVFWGGHVKNKRLCDVRFGREIAVEFDRPTAVQLDGEVVSGVTSYRAWK